MAEKISGIGGTMRGMTIEQEKAMNELTIAELMKMACEGYCTITGNGQVFAVEPETESQKWEERRVQNGY